LTDQLQELTIQQSTLSAQKQTARQSVRTLDRKINDLQNSLDSLSVDESDLTILKSQMQETTTALQTAQDEFVAKSWDTQISSFELQISRIEEDLKQIQTELTSTSAQSEFRAKIDVLKTDLVKKQQAQKMLISANAERFQTLMGQELTISVSDSQINTFIRRKTDDLEEAERVHEGTAKEISQFEAKLNTCKEQLRDKRKEKNTAKGKVMEVCEQEIDEFPALIETFEKSVSEIKLYSLPCRGGINKSDKSGQLDMPAHSLRKPFKRQMRNMFAVYAGKILRLVIWTISLNEYTSSKNVSANISLINKSPRRLRRKNNAKQISRKMKWNS
jgi:chromosome segregation ATPase